MSVAVSDIKRHSLLEDAQAIIAGTMMIALGINFYTQVGLLTGGTAGIAFLLNYIRLLASGKFSLLSICHFTGCRFVVLAWNSPSKPLLQCF